LLDVTGGVAGFGSAGVLAGSVGLSGNAEIEFASGSISKIASHSSLRLTGANAFIADAGSLKSNSALYGLSANFGTLDLVNGAQVATTGSLTNLGTLSLESNGGAADSSMTVGGALTTQGPVDLDATDGEGGSNLTIDGVLTNTGYISLGNLSLSQSSTVTATGLVNVQGSQGLEGILALSSDTTTAARMLLQVSGAAGFGTAGVLTGAVDLSGDSAIVFASGQISTINAGATLALDGPLAFVVDAGAQKSSPLNAALWRLRRRGRGFWVISLDFTCVWTRRVGSGLEPEFGAERVCG